MKRRKRIPLVLAAGILMLAAGLIGLQSVPEAEQYAFLPAEEKTADTLNRLETARTALADAFPRLTLHGMKNGVTLTAGGIFQNDVCLYLTGPGWSDVYPRRMISGRPIAGADAENGAKIIVLDEATAFKFFGEKDAVGKTVTLDGQTLEVVGVAVHSRRIGETGTQAAWVPLGTVNDPELMTLSAVDPAGSRMTTLFRNAAAEAFGSGTGISLAKEKTRATMIVRWVIIIAGVWLLRWAVGRLGGSWRKRAAQVREEQKKRYAARLIPWAARELMPAMIATAAVIGAGALLAIFAVEPAYVFPEWIPESLGDFSKWAARFWDLTGAAAQPVNLKTPELAEARFWGGLIRWGTVMALLGGFPIASQPPFGLKDQS